MLSTTEKVLPEIAELFPGFSDRVYFQNPETREYWFHASNVCSVLGFSNPTSALTLHCDDDEKLMEVVAGRQTWFVSEAGCYGLAMGAKNDIAKKFKRWLKHDVLPKLRAEGIVITANATQQTIDSAVQEWEDNILIFQKKIFDSYQDQTATLNKVRDRALATMQNLQLTDPMVKGLTANVKAIEKSLTWSQENALRLHERFLKRSSPKNSQVNLDAIENFVSDRDQFLTADLFKAFPQERDLKQAMTLLRSINYLPTSTMVDGNRVRVWVKSPYRI